MPALSPILSLASNITTIGSIAVSSSPNSTHEDVLKVICAWPVSGQYGPGTRILYYVLIAACILAKHKEWLVNACLAAALLLPAVAAIHGIVLTALHVHDAVDMDIYGAFQVCSIAILAAPVTVMMSETYMNKPGRNTIFLWTLLILVGMLCLAIEFYRTETFDCKSTGAQAPISTDISKFPLGDNNVCGLPFHCSTTNGPKSPMRGGAADNVYIIPVPNTVTFGTGTLIAATCCVHAVLCLVSMWDKVVDLNWKRRDVSGSESDHDEIIEGTRATKRMMTGINGRIRYFLSVIAIPIFGGVGLAILVLGEINFFSRQVRYQTEPIASVGQWAPICGTFMAVVGSLYLLLAADVQAVKEEARSLSSECQYQNSPRASSEIFPTVSHHESRSPSVDRQPLEGRRERRRRNTSASGQRSPSPLVHGNGEPEGSNPQAPRQDGNRHKVAELLIEIGNKVGTPSRGLFDNSFKRGLATGYPEIPAEKVRNWRLAWIKKHYGNGSREDATRPWSPDLEAADAGDLRSRPGRDPSPGTWSLQRSHASKADGHGSNVELQGVRRAQTNPPVASTSRIPRSRSNTLQIPPPTHPR